MAIYLKNTPELVVVVLCTWKHTTSDTFTLDRGHVSACHSDGRRRTEIVGGISQMCATRN